jgi:hypothetical protein
MSMVVLDSKNLRTQTEEGESYLPVEDGHRGVLFIGQAGRHGPTGLGGCVPLWLGSFSHQDHLPFVTFVPACSTSCTAQTLSSTPLLELLVLPLDALSLSHVYAPLLHLLYMPPWISCKVMLAAHPMLFLCMWSWWTLLGGHLVMHCGACMINLTRLPPSKHILWLSSPLISKITNNFRSMEELKHKFREVFKP